MIRFSDNNHLRIFMSSLIILIQIISFSDDLIASGIGLKVPIPIADEPSNNPPYNSKFVAGDGITIDTFPDTTSFLNRSFPIDALGQVEFPMIGKIDITVMSQEELEGFLKEQYKNYLRYPAVRVKPVIRISIVGGVARPGLYYIDDDYSIWDALHIAGGPLSEDGIKEMRLERNSDVIYDDLVPFFERANSLKSIGVRSGDQIWVPSPTRTGFWQDAAIVLPFLTFATSLLMIYFTYQTMVIAATR